ncbi:unnamed protein product, partial [Prorocentrum cordatum]
ARHMYPGDDVYDTDYSGQTVGIAAARRCPDRDRPPGITAAAKCRCRRAPTAVTEVAWGAAGDAYVATVLTSEAAAAEPATAAPAAGCQVPLASGDGPAGLPAVAGAAPRGQTAAAAGAAPPAPAAGVVVAATAQWVDAESTAFASRGDPVSPPANIIVRGDLAIKQAPDRLSTVVKNVQSLDTAEYTALEAMRDPHYLDGSAFFMARPRHRWSDVCMELVKAAYAWWTVPGPRVVKWCAEWFDPCSPAPAVPQLQFRSVIGLKPVSWGVELHGTALHVLGEAADYDSMNICDSVGIESLLRQAQLSEYVYRMDSMGATEKVGRDETPRASTVTVVGLMVEETVFSGINKSTGSTVVCPASLDHVVRAVGKDAAILKPVRKAKEERAALLMKQ